MKIESVEPIVLRVQPAETYWGARTWSADQGTELGEYPVTARRRYAYSTTIDTVLVRVVTSDGVVGWGECKAPVAAPATAALVAELLAPMIVGSRLDEIAVSWERMYAAMRVRGHDSGFWLEALSGVDIALWDAWARTLHQPIHALLGGAFRGSVPVYASGIPAGADTDRVRVEAERLVAAGYTAIKVAIGTDPGSDVTSVAAVTDVVGPTGRVFADAAGQYDLRQALRVGRALGELGIGFFEMPIPPEDIDGYRDLAQRLDTPLALDSLATRHRALDFLRLGALHVLQPDVCRAGGITGVTRIAALADAFGAMATPHVSIGSAVHFAASLQCAAAMPNFDICEYWIGTNPLGTPVAPDIEIPASGQWLVGSGPGLGITVDESAVRTLAERTR
ncbi:mandelate racemase/muconate lactonizing enzyme family protein [Dactylosporangium siamense]|uniref:Enolase n=1 Tax=Dactylosporangium siamense TaxID=685454 RepID=A0A919UEU9_9ACTN|nr:mandelate racemase/muconate lactonizing enzyme family protein [Dactylosporangium siamense]GIG52977.1 enolase [Dactylosporangium siamense]